MKQTIRVLITGAGTTTAQCVIKALRNQQEVEVKIFSCDASKNVAGRFLSDKFFTILPAHQKGYVESLLSVVKKTRADLLIPIVDYEFKKISASKKSFFSLGCTPVISDTSTINICIDKFKTARFFQKNNIPHPKTYLHTKRLKLSSYPLFIKPSYLGRAGIDAYKISTKQQLEYYQSQISKPIIQEHITGREITIDVLNNLEGNFLFAVPRLRLETKNGVSVKGKIYKNKQLEAVAKKIAEKLHIIGPCNIQCFQKKNGEFVFTEINLRFSGANILTTAAGLNYPLLLCISYLQKNKPFNYDKRIKKLTMYRYWEEIFTLPNESLYNPLWQKSATTNNLKEKNYFVFDFDQTLTKKIILPWNGVKKGIDNIGKKLDLNITKLSLNDKLYVLRTQNKESQAIEILKKFEKQHRHKFVLNTKMVIIVKRLKNEGKKVAIVSDNYYDTIFSTLSREHLNNFFDNIISRDNLLFYKPYPEGIEKVRRAWNIRKKKMIYVGNSENDRRLALQYRVDYLNVEEFIKFFSK